MASKATSHKLQFRLLAVFGLLTALIGAAGYAFFDHLKTAEKIVITEHLASTGKLRAGYLASFLNERRGDTRLLAATLGVSLNQDWWSSTDRALPAALQHQLKSVLTSYGYSDALVLDAEVILRFSTGRSTGLSDTGKRHALHALNQQAPVFSDLYLADPAAPESHMLDTFAPIMSRDGDRAVGVLVLRGNWDQLFSLTQPWPDQSRTAEYLLARKDGDHALFLNQLRGQQQGEHRLRVPLSEDEQSSALPAIRAVQGHYGAHEAFDYRGKAVWAYTLPVPGTDWIMVAKVDAEEALSSLQRLEKITLITTLAFIAILFEILRRWLAARNRAGLALQRERDLAASLIEAAPAVIVMLDLEGRIQHVNPYFEKLAGYRLDEVHGKDWFDTFLPERDRDNIRALFRTAAHDVPTRGNVNPIVTRRGEEREIEWHAQTTLDERGNIVSVLAIGQDVTVRVQMQNIERENQRRLQNILDNMLAFFGLYTLEGIMIEVNRMPLNAAGLKREDVIGKPFWDTYWWSYSPESQAHAKNALHRAAQGEIVRDDFRVRVAEDRFLIVDAMFSPLRDEAGRITQIVGSGFDISDRKQIEQALKDSEEQFRATFEQAAVGVAHIGLQGQWLRVNTRLCELLGYSRAELLVSSFQDITHRDDLAANLGYVKRLQAGEISTYSMEKRYLHKNGGIVWANLTVSLVRSNTGAPRYFISIVEDIGNRKSIELALRTSEKRLKEAQRIAQIGSWELDLVNGKLSWSDEIFRLFEIDKAQFGATYEAFLSTIYPEDREAVNAAYTRSLETRTPYEITHRLRMADGRIKHVHERCESEFDAEGKPLYSLGTTQDITERKIAEKEILKLNAELDQRVQARTAELQSANKELETFTYSVSHDLKAPLRGIDGYSRLLLDTYSDTLGDEGRGYLQNVRQAAQQMGQLINDLLTYSRLEHRDMQIGQVDPQALIESLLADRADEIRTRGVAVTVAVPFSSATADREGLVMALRNLLENALKFTGNVPHPEIQIGGRNAGTTCILSVRDNGVGFDMKFHDRIFGIFQRLHRSEDYPGTGVGLAIARKAMDRMGGRAWAESEPGKGATFYLEIPK